VGNATKGVEMVVHKIKDDKTACGIEIRSKNVEASIHWQDVDCKKCLKKAIEKSKLAIV